MDAVAVRVEPIVFLYYYYYIVLVWPIISESFLWHIHPAAPKITSRDPKWSIEKENAQTYRIEVIISYFFQLTKNITRFGPFQMAY